MVTIKMIAQRCGLSVGAVSKALNNQPGISPERAEQVRRVAQEMGYYPNAVARSLKTSRGRNIGLLYQNSMSHAFFSLVIDGIRDTLGKYHYDLTLLSNDMEHNIGYYEQAKQRFCDGVIVVQHYEYDDAVQNLVDSGLPVVSIECSFPGHSAVLTENRDSMTEVVRYLHSMGHTRLAFVHGDMGDITDQRLEGFRRGCRECGIDVPEECVVPARFHSVHDSARATRYLLKLPQRPSCILYPDDVSYLGGLDELESQGLRVGEDISCFGFDGLGLMQLMRPSLASYRQNAWEMGKIATEDLISAVERPETYVARTYQISGQIQSGKTVKNLKKTV